ncbi:MAG: hypothetical protein ACRENX_06345 [Candidatus Dormibacteria bacterium]
MIKLLHPADGQLRRMIDEPLLVPDRVQAHVRGCLRCTARRQVFSADAAVVQQLLPPERRLALNIDSAWAATQRRLGTAGPAPRPSLSERLPWRLTHPGRPAVAVATLAVLAVGTGMGTAVAGVQWTQIFAPAKVVSLPVTRSELLALPHLSEFGKLMKAPDLKLTAEPNLAAAEAAAGVTVSLPNTLPQGVTGPPSYLVLPRWTSTFTFSSAETQAAALAAGVTLSPLPAGFDGTELRESVGPGVVVVYGLGGGSHPLSLSDLFGVSRHSSRVKCAAASVHRCGKPGVAASTSALPTLALMAVKPPNLESTGVTVSQLENYLLSLPFLPSSLATAIHQLGNPITSLPIPVLTDLGQSQPANVNGNSAVLFAADSPLVSAVIWEQQGIVRAVGGLVDSRTVLGLARG